MFYITFYYIIFYLYLLCLSFRQDLHGARCLLRPDVNDVREEALERSGQQVGATGD